LLEVFAANVQQTSSKCIQNTTANAGRLLDRVNTPLEIRHGLGLLLITNRKWHTSFQVKSKSLILDDLEGQ